MLLFSAPGCGTHGIAGTVTPIRYDAVLISNVYTIYNPAAQIASKFEQQCQELNIYYCQAVVCGCMILYHNKLVHT